MKKNENPNGNHEAHLFGGLFCFKNLKNGEKNDGIRNQVESRKGGL
jgi:hypothetical protein